MESYYEKPILMLNKLISDLNIGADIFEKASSETDADNLKKLFEKIKKKDVDYRSRLEDEVKKYDGKLVSNQENSNKNDFLDSLKKNEKVDGQKRNLKILEYCKEVEYNTQIEFSKVVGAEIPGETKDIVTEQYNEIRDFHDTLKVLIEREKIKNKN